MCSIRQQRAFGKITIVCAITILFALKWCDICRSEIVFDGMTWYHSHDPTGRLSVNGVGHLIWKCRKPDQLIARLKKRQRISKIGDVVEFSCLWKSSGDIIGTNYRKKLCHDDCVICMAGTGDFRIGLFEATNEQYITRDAEGLESDVFRKWRGYQWRFSPHLQAREPKRWYEPKPDGSRESHTNLRFWNRTEPDNRSLLSSKKSWSTMGYEPFAGGFEVPQNKFRLLSFRLKRESENRIAVSITLNGKTFIRIDNDPCNQPKTIDVFAIHMPNARPYNEVVLAPVPRRYQDGAFDSKMVPASDYNDGT